MVPFDLIFHAHFEHITKTKNTQIINFECFCICLAYVFVTQSGY